MSAIWGAVNLLGKPIDKETQIIMRKAFDRCVIDRYEEIINDNVYMGCGIQYFAPEAILECLPMSEGEVFYTADVVLDNRSELIKKLEISASDANGMADGAILYAMYRKYGKSCLNDLLGAYTFVWYDRKKNQIELVLDAVGNRCLYYEMIDGTLYFSSLLEPLAEISENTKLNDRWIVDFLAMDHLFNINETEETPFADIYRIAPAQYVVCNQERMEKELYWRPFDNFKELRLHSDAEYKQQFNNVWDKAVKDVIRTDSNVSILLSGGLDSTAVAAVAAPYLKEKGKNLYSYTSVPMKGYKSEDNGYDVDDESDDVKKTAEYYGNIVTDFIDLDGKTPWELVGWEYEKVEMPFKSIQNSLWIAEAFKRAYQNGSRLILTGSYGNTTISNTDLNVYMNELFHQKRYRKLKNEVDAFAQTMDFEPRYALKQIYHDCNEQYSTDPYLYKHSFVKRSLAENMGTPIRLEQLNRNQSEAERDYEKYRKQLVLWIALRQIGEIATKHSLATGVLLRDPTKDKRIIEFCIHLPMEQFCKEGVDRRLVKVYLKDRIPPHVLSYGKKGRQSADLKYRFEKNWNQIRCEWIEEYERFDGSRYVNTIYARRQLIEEPDISKYSSFDLTRHMYTLMVLRYENYISKRYPLENERLYQKYVMPEEELISVIIPVYNVSKYLEKCVRSVCEQSYQKLEIILVDDGSTDGSDTICDNLACEDSRIVVIHQENSGVSSARNAGLACSHGKYIGFVDGDDWIDKDMYKILYELLVENDAELSCCNYRRIFPDRVSDFSDNRVRVYYGGEMFDTWKTGHEMCLITPAVWNKLYKAELFDDVEFPEIRKHEDGVVNAEILKKIKCGVFINRAYYNYVENMDSLTHESMDFKAISEFIESNKRQLSVADGILCENSKRRMYFNYYCILLDRYCKIPKGIEYSDICKKIISKEIHRIQKVVQISIGDDIQRGIKSSMHLMVGTYSPKLYQIVLKIIKRLK